jgi:hypothetical protein
MKPANDDINWQVVHRTHEGNPVKDENPDRQLWNEQLRWVTQQLGNLEFVSLTEPNYVTLHAKYTAQKQEVCQKLERLK